MENRTNRYEHVAMVHEHVWRTRCSVCTTGARVAHPLPCNSSFVVLEVSPAPSPCCFNSLFTGLVRVGVNFPLDGKRLTNERKRVLFMPNTGTRYQQVSLEVILYVLNFYNSSTIQNKPGIAINFQLLYS